MKKPGQLPSELISLILDNVDEEDLYLCTLINTSFYNQTIPLLWRNLNIRSEHTLHKIAIAMSTSARTPNIHVRSISVQFKLTNAELLSLIRYVPLLDHLHLANAVSITDDSFHELGSRCPLLTTLDIHRAQCTHVGMANLGQYCHHLSTLVMHRLPNVDYIKLFSALDACPLKSITINARCIGKHRPLGKATALALQHQKHLTSLTVDNWPHSLIELNSPSRDHSAFITAGVVWPHLTYVRLDTCRTLTDRPTIRFLQAHPHIECLDLRTTKLTDRTLDVIPTALPVLKHFKIHFSPDVTGDGICRLVKHCDDGIDCYRCGISWQDNDFPHKQLQGLYKVDLMNGGGEVIWLSGHAFDK